MFVKNEINFKCWLEENLFESLNIYRYNVFLLTVLEGHFISQNALLALNFF